ncbi:acetyl/propionyl/methylcrotonyl-CoA carboxylase subunit alpha [Nocardioides caeni]|uniref:Biotin/lipoyl-binding protein n=1 Tax=Nocardioides caeni TaxID=574700 RepID=A0A4S8N010_9ACTN|nr:biotin carboxylase N-terminal domain-containing protein [Nocardioides caeni]THV09088.1 biotin/lipoyl-binding protein [Nocardioides caeni]
MTETSAIRSILVANRGEIARRVFRTGRDLGIRTVAVHTDVDAEALHVRDADLALRIPSYLDADAVLAAAVEADADAIHPGYGFLSENAAFARAVIDAGLTWIGPTPEVIEQMGRKDAARELAVAAGVPVVPSYDLGDDTASFVYPVLVKAAAGGGGKGMRIVRSAAELPEAMAAAKREALGAFGDDAMIIEKYVERGRHIEVQVIGDAHGNVIHLGTRECSVQRRHQKVIEEAPAPGLDDELRERMHQAAVDLGKAVEYTNAGTVELLLDAATNDFYFLEMNTRLQVEHPVTEEVNHTDLVALQLHVASGAELDQADWVRRLAGHEMHAIEARVYAEDAFNGFLPQAGTAAVVAWPESARVDHALESGQVVGTSYDPMLAKVIAVGVDRESARRRLVDALDDTAILGLTTNTGFLRELVASEVFAEPGGIDTAWLDRNKVPAPDPAPARAIAARLWLDAHAAAGGPFAGDGFRMGGPPAAPLVTFDEDVTAAARVPEGTVARVTAHDVELVHRGQRFVFTRPDATTDHAADAGDGTVAAPMPGIVVDVRVTEGEQVVEGQVLGVVEAMKMELALKAPYDGTVTRVAARTTDQVALGAPLFVVDRADRGEES